jgi:hypothetical protein
MSNETEILHPVKSLTIAGQEVTVKELPWFEAIEFIKKLSGFIGSLIDANGTLRVDIGAVTEMIVSTDELATTLITKTTGKDSEWVKTLSLSDALSLLDTALALNLSDEIIQKGKSIAGRFRRFAGEGMRTANPASQKPSPI